MTREQVDALIANVNRTKGASTSPDKENGMAKPVKSKYGNRRVKDDLGNWFDSVKELERWKVLQLLYMKGAITELRRQVSYELNEGGTFSYKYKADFTYFENGVFIVEDVKGFATNVFKKKSKLMLKVHGITIKIT